MRPRVFPAEDVSLSTYYGVLQQASMRPRVFPAEDVDLYIAGAIPSCFNEAAGIPRGRPTDTRPVRPVSAPLQ